MIVHDDLHDGADHDLSGFIPVWIDSLSKPGPFPRTSAYLFIRSHVTYSRGLAERPDRLVLFELKNAKNKKAGALSELLFYATLMREVQKKNVRFEERPQLAAPSYRSIAANVGGRRVLLAPKLHPLLEGDGHSVLRELNTAFDAAGEPIRFGVCTFDAGGAFKRIEVPPRPRPGRALGS